MSEKSLVTAKENDVARRDQRMVDLINQQSVSRPQGWNHTPAHNLQTKCARRTENVARQFTLQSVCRGGYGLFRLTHETLGVVWQESCVPPCTLPHDNAVVTNICSKRKDGFSYGFLLSSRDRGVSEEILFVPIDSYPFIYCNADCEACMAQPPVPDVPQT